MSDIGLFEGMYSVRALRRLKSDPVPEEMFGPVQRRPINEVAYADRWGTTWPG
jgi:hypothetical protein